MACGGGRKLHVMGLAVQLMQDDPGSGPLSSLIGGGGGSGGVTSSHMSPTHTQQIVHTHCSRRALSLA